MHISIIIPVYNAELTIHRCLNSILCQKLSDYEVIIVDDGSTDDSPVICDDYANKYPHIVTTHKKNGGASSARNVGLDIAKGEWIAFLDSDDEISEEWYKCLNQAFENIHDSENTLIIENAIFIYPDGKRRQVFSRLSFQIFNDVFKAELAGSTCNKIFRKSVIDKYSIRFDESLKFSEDCLFVATYCRHMSNIYYINNPIYIQYLPESYSKKYSQYMNWEFRLSLYSEIRAVNEGYAHCMVDGLFMTFISNFKGVGRKELMKKVEQFKDAVGPDIRHVKGKKKIFIRSLANVNNLNVWYYSFTLFSFL